MADSGATSSEGSEPIKFKKPHGKKPLRLRREIEHEPEEQENQEDNFDIL